MGEATKIEWAHHSWSPWRGCEKVSAGCQNCYAEALSRRNPAVLGEWGKDGRRVVNADWKKPLRWDRAAAKAGERRRVFPSLCDLFEDRPDLDKPLARFLGLIDETPHLDWLVLTKRLKLWAKRLRAAADTLPRRGTMGPFTGTRWNIVDWLQRGKPSGRAHPPNVWLGVSVENQATADERIPLLQEIPAAVRWLSVEPLLGPVDLIGALGGHCLVCGELVPAGQSHHTHDGGLHSFPVVPGGIDWVVVGGESGPDARPCDVAWIRSIVQQCKAAGVPVFVKQLGSKPIEGIGTFAPHHPDCYRVYTRHPKGGDPAEWPEDLRVREFPDAARAAARGTK